MKPFLVIGDSHAAFWRGRDILHETAGIFEGLDLFPVGPVTAYSLFRSGPSDPNKADTAHARIEAHLQAHATRYGCLIFCFGEIDCRVHIVKQAILAGLPINEVARRTAAEYAGYVRALSVRYGIPCLLWGPLPSLSRNFNAAYPAVGSAIERNFATMSFNDTLSSAVQGVSGLEHFSLIRHLLTPRFDVRDTYLYDGVHLSNTALDMAEQQLRFALIRLGIDEAMEPALKRRWPVADMPTNRNVAAGRPYILSSVYGNLHSGIALAAPVGAPMFHTDIEDRPEMLLELDASYLVHTVVVHNRSDNCLDRAASIAVALSSDGIDFKVIYAPDEYVAPGIGTGALRIQVENPSPVRFVKLYLRERNYLHLDCVEILAPSFLAAAS